MSKEIKLDKETKEKVNDKLSTVVDTSNTEINNISTVIENINTVANNPEILNITNNLAMAQEGLIIEKDNVTDFKDKVDNNLQELIDLDEEIARQYAEGAKDE